MLWKGRRQSTNIEDRRGDDGGFGGGLGGGMGGPGGFRFPTGGGGGGRIGGGSIFGLLVVLGIMWLLGVNPLQVLGELEGGGPSPTSYQTSPQRQSRAQSNDEGRQFVATVLADTEDVWGDIFQAAGQRYVPTTLVLFTGLTRSACGGASAETGPFYCPLDKKVYIDLAFYDELKRRFQAPGDFARAYVLAHEVGHHVQDLTGVLPKFNQLRQRMSEDQANALSVRVELQADCYAGIWANKTAQKGLVEAGDLDDALNAATQIGDDQIQKRTQGYVVPETFTHGTAAQRKSWFQRGFDTGRMDQCDTFSGDI